ncbi:MAG: hypothetical protein ABJH04_07715 [Cyclobacteriaceae bacterium]
MELLNNLEPLHFTHKFNNSEFKVEEYPSPEEGKETYRQYRARVDKLSDEAGFHIGDLSDSDYQIYCMGSGSYRGFYGADELIGDV